MLDKSQSEKIASLKKSFQENSEALPLKKATVGFDGFIDIVSRVIKNKEAHQAPVFFQETSELGLYIQERSGKSLCLELEEIETKIGGNTPIMAHALGQLGVHVNCIGSLGHPGIHPVFDRLSSNCSLHSFANPGFANALEFDDGKLMFAQIGRLNTIRWENIKATLGLSTLIRLFDESDFICLLNWSELDSSTGIWKGLLQDVFPKLLWPSERQKFAFFDLSDCSKRNNKAIREALSLIEEIAGYYQIILSLNRNESQLIYQALYLEKAGEEMEYTGQRIFEKLSIEMLVIHTTQQSYAFSRKGWYKSNSFFTANPTISTGAGDNFNAGFCIAQLLGLDVEASLLLGNAVSGYYVKEGQSPQSADIKAFLEEKLIEPLTLNQTTPKIT